MKEQVTADEYSATISADSVVRALELNATNGADDRVIEVPRKQDGEASVRRAFRGSERYANPDSAPVHIELIEVWESDARSMARAEHNIELYDHNGEVCAIVTIVGV